MSHRAKDWLAGLDTRNLKGSDFKVLFFLCDFHNGEKPPNVACYPSQALLMEKAGISNGSVNNAMNRLEDAGLIERIAGTVPGSAKRRTYYLLGCDANSPKQQTPKTGVSPNSSAVEFVERQTPENDTANSKKVDTKLHATGEEPVKEPVKEPCVSSSLPHTQEFVFEDLVSQFEAAYPRLGDGPSTEAALKKAIEEGADPAAILAGASGYAAEQKGNGRQFIKLSENWLNEKRWTWHAPNTSSKVTRERILETHAKTIKQGKSFLCTAITDQTAWECVQAELVTVQECHAVGKLL